MPKTITKKICELFKPINGNSKYTKLYCSQNPGDFIVYTGTTIGIFGKVNNADYNFPQLTFTTDGENAGTIEYITDDGYCIGGHRTILKPIVDDLDLLYLKFVLQPIFFENVRRGDVPSLHFNRVKNLEISLPILTNGKFDLEKQKELAFKFQEIENKKKQLLCKIDYLKSTKVLLEEDSNIRYDMIPLNKMIVHNNGKSIYTKEYCENNKGNYPVYSANNQTPLAYMNKFDYSGSYLTYSKNGCAGYLNIISGEFSINGDRCVIMLNKGFENIDLMYLKYILEPIFRANIKGRIGINGKNEYTKINSTMIKKLNIQVKIPILENGHFDLEKQRALAEKYANIESIKKEIYNKVKKLTLINIL